MSTEAAIRRRMVSMSMAVGLAVASVPSAGFALPSLSLPPTSPVIAARAKAPPCSEQKKAEVLAPATGPATAATRDVRVDCSLELRPGDVVTKRLLLYGDGADGVKIECNGATIDGSRGSFHRDQPLAMVQIFSEQVRHPATGALRWARPEIVTLRGCNIVGHVSVAGAWGETEVPNTSPDFVAYVRDNAPRHVVLDDVTITGMKCSKGGNEWNGGACSPVYVFSGVSDFQMVGSEIKGETYGVNVYLDAESHRSTLRDNTIHAKTSGREVMAIDGSSHNLIVDNHFSALENGGIYLYRNCGEGGAIRHTTPSHNRIINNFFYYDWYRGGNPAIFVGQRNGDTSDNWDCSDDAGHPIGSSISDFDHAQHNVVMQNQIRKRSVGDMIKVGRPDVNTPNYIDHNETVDVRDPRPAGCWVGSAYKPFIRDGQFIDLFQSASGEPVCRGASRGDARPNAVASYLRYMCDDGVLSEGSSSTCQVSYVPFECQVTDDDGGCQATAACPAGKKIIGARAACNLEFGSVSSTDLSAVPLDPYGGPITNFVKVVRASDKISDGSCTLGFDSGLPMLGKVVTTIRSGAAPAAGLNYLPTSASFGCRERDKNGGDCHIKGTLYCR